MDEIEENMVNRSSSTVSSTDDLLQVMYETPVNTLATEKGNCYISQNTIDSQKNDFSCYFCGEVSNSRAGRVNHERKHRKEIAKEKRRKSVERRKKQFNIYACEECGTEFEKKINLTRHLKTHIEEIECTACHAKFKDRMDFEWHDAISDGKNFGNEDKPFHRTRSQSRLSCHGAIERVKRSKSCVPSLSIYSKNNTFPEVSKRKRSPSALSDCSTPYKKIRNTNNEYMSETSAEELTDNDDDDDDDDAVDQEMNQMNQLNQMNQMNELSTINDIPIMPSWDLMVKAAAKLLKVIKCPHAECSEYFYTLDHVTMHEMSRHNTLALFRCPECRRRYTTNANLRAHQDESHKYTVLCPLCDALLNNEEVQMHLTKHQKVCFPCEKCGKRFCDEDSLEKHMNCPKAHRLYYPSRVNVLERVHRKTRLLSNRFEESDMNFGAFYLDSFETNVIINELQVHLPWRTREYHWCDTTV